MVQGDLLLLAAGAIGVVNKALDRVRQYIARELKLIQPGQHALLWVTDFPMYDWNEDEQRLEVCIPSPCPDWLEIDVHSTPAAVSQVQKMQPGG